VLQIAVFSILFPVSFPNFENFAAVLRNLAVDGILAVGMMVMLITGLFDLSVGGMLSMIGVITGWLIKQAGFPVWLAILTGLAVAALRGLINGLVVAKLRVNALITTLGWRRAGGRRRAGRCFQPPPAKLMGFNKQQTIYWTAFWPVQYDSTISLVFSIWFQQHYQFRFKTRTRRCFPDSEDNAFAGLLPSDPTFQPIPY